PPRRHRLPFGEPVAPARPQDPMGGRAGGNRRRRGGGPLADPAVPGTVGQRVESPRCGDLAMNRRTFAALACLVLIAAHGTAADADLILHNGKVVTVDPAFSVHRALAVRDGKVLVVGTD